MKDLITTIASLLLLMIFVLQFSANQVTHFKVFQSGLAVESFRDTLKEEGTVTPDNAERLRQALAGLCGCSPSEITVTVHPEDGQMAAGQLIYYEIIFPLQNLIVMGSALGITPEENQSEIKEKGWVVSAYEEYDHNDGADSPDESGNDS